MKYIRNKNFWTMDPGLGNLYKIHFSDLSQCYFPKLQPYLFKTTLLSKTKIVSLQGSSHWCSQRYLFRNLITTK